MSLDNIIGVGKAAEILGNTPGTIKNKCASGQLNCKKIGNTWVLDKTNLEEELQMGRTVQYETENYTVVEVNEMFMTVNKNTEEESDLFETVEEAIESLPERN